VIGFADFVLDHWLLAVTGRWDIAAAFVNEPTPGDFKMRSNSVGVGVGRRFEVGSTNVDAMLGPNLILETQDADDGQREIHGAAGDFRLGVSLKVSGPRSSSVRAFAVGDFEASPTRVRSLRYIDRVLGKSKQYEEDVGTVFEVAVLDQQTRSIAVHEGRVVVRLHAIPEFTLSAGEAWRRPDSAASDSPSVAAGGETLPGIVPVHRPSARKAQAPVPELVPATPSKPVNRALSDASQINGSLDEDRAYLNIVTLLNRQRDAAAQSAAKQYLLQFPNGFRRIEVLNVVVRNTKTVRNGG